MRRCRSRAAWRTVRHLPGTVPLTAPLPFPALPGAPPATSREDPRALGSGALMPDRLLELLRPPAHRGPLIASGAVLVTLGVLLEELRLADRISLGVHLAILAVAAAVMLALGLQARPEGGRPPAFQSVLLVCGLILLAPALARLADVLGADSAEFPAGAVVWTSLVFAGMALWPAIAKGSSICALLGALALGVTLLAFTNWSTGAGSATTYRWLL